MPDAGERVESEMEPGDGPSRGQDFGDQSADIDKLPEEIFYRIVRSDSKGRPFGTPGNPRSPTFEEFNPRILEIRAGSSAP